MWTTKISFDGTKRRNILAEYSKKYRVKILIFPLSWIYKKSGVIVNITGTIHGNERSKEKFISSWSKGKNLFKIERNEDFFVGVIKEYPNAKAIWNKNIIFTRPLLIDEKGIETFVVHSFDKKYLINFIKIMEKYHSIKIHYIKQEKIKNISFKIIAPDLTEKQKEAMNLAISEGYYQYPRRISIKNLSKKTKLSFSTFHSHLRKAERKLMPFFFSD